MTNCVGYEKLLFHEQYAASTRNKNAHSTSVEKKNLKGSGYLNETDLDGSIILK